MKKLLIVLFAVLCSCGYSARNAELTGQVKKVARATPIICDDYDTADISLGVMRGGVGSMSTQDVWVYIADPRVMETLKKAAETGELVKVQYDEVRFTFCKNTDSWATGAQILPK